MYDINSYLLGIAHIIFMLSKLDVIEYLFYIICDANCVIEM